MVDINTLVDSFSLDELKEVKKLVEEKLENRDRDREEYIRSLNTTLARYDRGDFKDIAKLATLWASGTVGMDWSKEKLEQYYRHITDVIAWLSKELKRKEEKGIRYWVEGVSGREREK